MNLSRRHREDDRENLDRWLITYADLITLLLAFFIMLYTFSKQDARKYQDLSSELKTIFSGGKTEKAAAVQAGVAAGQKPSTDIERELEDELAALAGGKGEAHKVSVFKDERGTVIRAMDTAFFDEGRAEAEGNGKGGAENDRPHAGKDQKARQDRGAYG